VRSVALLDDLLPGEDMPDDADRTFTGSGLREVADAAKLDAKRRRQREGALLLAVTLLHSAAFAFAYRRGLGVALIVVLAAGWIVLSVVWTRTMVRAERARHPRVVTRPVSARRAARHARRR
jgi:hypothetical protein